MAFYKISPKQEDMVIRFGGEEFIVVLVGKNKYEVKNILDLIREELNKKEVKNNIKISFSAGIKEWDNTNVDKLIEEADYLLYEAKHQGKNRVNI